jgi:hypothetical protein
MIKKDLGIELAGRLGTASSRDFFSLDGDCKPMNSLHGDT